MESGYSILHDEPPPLPPSVPTGVAQVDMPIEIPLPDGDRRLALRSSG